MSEQYQIVINGDSGTPQLRPNPYRLPAGSFDDSADDDPHTPGTSDWIPSLGTYAFATIAEYATGSPADERVYPADLMVLPFDEDNADIVDAVKTVALRIIRDTGAQACTRFLLDLGFCIRGITLAQAETSHIIGPTGEYEIRGALSEGYVPNGPSTPYGIFREAWSHRLYRKPPEAKKPWWRR